MKASAATAAWRRCVTALGSLPYGKALSCAPLSSLLFSSLLLACSGGHPRAATAPAATLSTGAAPDGRPMLALDAATARGQGAGAIQVIAVDAATPGDRVSGTLIVPERSCVMLMARVSESIDDVDLFAYADDGSVLGSDERADKRPSLLICPPHPKRVFVVARVASGHGLVALGGQLVAPEHAKQVAAALGSQSAQPTPSLWSGFETALAAERSALGSAWKDQRRAALPALVSAPTVTALAVPADRCLNVFLTPSSGVSHLDVALLDPQGRTLGRAASRGRDRSLQVCSAEDSQLSLEIRPHLGEGLVALLVSQATRGAVSEGAETIRYLTATALPLDQAITADRTLTRRLGLQRATKHSQGQAPVASSAGSQLSLPAGCSRVDVVLGAPTRGVSARLWDSAGALLAEASGDPTARLFACTQGGSFRLDVEADVRPGPYAILLAHNARAAHALRKQPLAAGRLLSLFTARGVLRGGRQLAGVEQVDLSEVALVRRELIVPPGRCLELGLSAGAGVGGLDLVVFKASPGGGDLAEPNSTPAPGGRAAPASSGSALAEPLTLSRGPRAIAARQCNLDGHGPLPLALELRSQGGSGTALFGWQMLSPSP